MIRRSAALAPALASALVVAACGILGPSDPDLSLRLDVRPSVAPEVGMTVEVEGRSFSLDGPGSLDVHAPGTGEKEVVVTLRRPSDTLVRHALIHDFQAGSDHWIHALVGGARPLGHCLGRLTALPLPGPAADTVFLLDGSLPEDAIC